MALLGVVSALLRATIASATGEKVSGARRAVSLGAVLFASATSPALSNGVADATPGVGSSFTVPAGVREIRITAEGGSGGVRGIGARNGGAGATARGVFAVTPGDTIYYIVGEQGGAGSGFDAGGGGSTGVFINGTLVVVAGGGAGYDNTAGGGNNQGGRAVTAGGAGVASSGCAVVPGGTGGAGGGGGNQFIAPCAVPTDGGAGGGGVNSAGGTAAGGATGGGAADLNPLDGLTAASGGVTLTDADGTGANGGRGFTGGGASEYREGGGGGGYSGGGGGNSGGRPGGGGSFVSPTAIQASTTNGANDTNNGHGSVVIEWSTLTISKSVVNDDGGVNIPGDFTFHVTSTFGDQTGAASHTDGDVIPITSNGSSNSYTITEDPLGGYLLASNSCAPLVHSRAQVGTDYTCTLVNDDPPISIVAQTDDFRGTPINGVTGGTTATIFTNDFLTDAGGTTPASSANVAVAILNPAVIPGATVDANGILSVPPGSSPGTYSIPYEICATPGLTKCASAIIIVILVSIDAHPEAFASVNGTAGGTTASVLGSDTLNGAPIANPADVVLTSVTVPAGLTLNADGTITVASGTAAGVYNLTYQICDAANPTICDTQIEVVTVGTIDAVAEVFPPVNSAVGGTTTSVLASDTLNGAPIANPADVILTTVAIDPELTLNPDGTITVTPGTPNGTYTLTYQICDAAIPTICDTVIETVAVGSIDAQPETFPPVNAATGGTTASSVFASDTLGGAPIANPADVVLTVTGSTGGLTLNGANQIVVPAGLAPGIYTLTYQICDVLVPTICDTQVEPVTVAGIDAQPEIFPAIDGTSGGTTASVIGSDTLNGAPIANPADVVLTGVTVPVGLTLNANGTITIAPGTPTGSYAVTYQICDAANPTICDTQIETVTVGAIDAVAEAFPAINAATGGTTTSILASDTLVGAQIANPADVVVTVTGATGGLTLNGANQIVVPAGLAAGPYTLTYRICDALNPAICDTVTETVTVGGITAAPETFPPVNGAAGGTTGSILASDTLNGAPIGNPALVTISTLAIDPELTLNPNGTVTVAPGTASGVYTLDYRICDVANPTFCATATETVTVSPVTAIETTKLITSVTDNGDGVTGVGDTINFSITVENLSNVALSNIAVTDMLSNIAGAPLSLTTGPAFASATLGSPAGTLNVGETATYDATYLLTVSDVTAGGVQNRATGAGDPFDDPAIPGTPPRISDLSDDGNDADGNVANDPTQLKVAALPAVAGLTLTKVAGLSQVQRGGRVPYTITITNANPVVTVNAVTVDSLPAGFVYVPGTGAVNGTAQEPSGSGRQLRFAAVTVPPLSSATITLAARVLAVAQAGDNVNTANILDPLTGLPLTAPATATVRIEVEPVFDCGDVIGKVYDDRNRNGYQDQGEPGLPAVRVAGVDGTIITTDQFGRFHVPCAVLPQTSGSNFILKVDARSLPTGYRLTTENPRVVRLTRGKMSEINFGEAITRVARIDLNARGFVATDNGIGIVSGLLKGADTLLRGMVASPSTIRLAYHLQQGSSEKDRARAAAELKALERFLRERWREVGGRAKLTIEKTYVRSR